MKGTKEAFKAIDRIREGLLNHSLDFDDLIIVQNALQRQSEIEEEVFQLKTTIKYLLSLRIPQNKLDKIIKQVMEK